MAAQTQLADSAQREESLQTQLRQQQAAREELQEKLAKEQAEREEREAQIRQEEHAAKEKEISDLKRKRIEQDQAEYAQQEALIRADEEAKAEERYALQREQDAIEKQRLERAAAEAQAKVADMQRQLGQGSVELQGEALEVYLKRQLQAQFPFDQIEDIGRGQLGADLTAGGLRWTTGRLRHRRLGGQAHKALE